MIATPLIIFGMVVDLVDSQLNSRFRLVNLYGLYADRVLFWENLCDYDILYLQNFIIGGDLNFTSSIQEVWGAHPRRDAQEFFLVQWIEKNQLVDLEPVKLSQTWRNGRGGVNLVAKQIDIFLLS
jgi:hypothetical protein